MPTLQAIHGRLIDVRRYNNVHLYHARRPLGPTDRYEIWIRPDEGTERKFTINTRNMPARPGHVVSLILTKDKKPQVVALANWTTIDGVNYARTDAPPVLRTYDLPVVLAAYLMMLLAWDNFGMLLFIPVSLMYLLITATWRVLSGTRLAREVDKAIDAEARRTQAQTEST